MGRSIESNSVTWFLKRGNRAWLRTRERRAQNKDLVADAQTLLEENLSEKKSIESARRLGKSKILKMLHVFIGLHHTKRNDMEKNLSFY